MHLLCRKSLLEEQIVHDPAPDTSDSEDPVAAKRNKRKAPRAPPTDPEMEELPESQQNLRDSLQVRFVLIKFEVEFFI